MMILSRLDGVISVAGAIPMTVEHAHHAVQFTRARTGAIQFEGSPQNSVLIAAKHPHQLQADDALTLLIEPESHVGRQLVARFLDAAPFRIDVGLDPTRTPLQALLSDEDLCKGRHLDPRIQAVLAWLDTCQEAGTLAEVNLSRALRVACLSESRFLHLFKEQTGTPWRPALAWRRAQVAMQIAASGQTLTDAAYRAGYADSAHLSRQFKSLFGLSPSIVLKNSRIVQGD